MHQLEAEGTSFNYRGPKGIVKNETTATICTANTVGHVWRKKLLKVLLDSGSYVRLIRRTATTKGINLKYLAGKKCFNTLAGTLHAQQMVML